MKTIKQNLPGILICLLIAVPSLANRQKIPGNRRSGDRHYHWNAYGTGMDTFRESKNRHYLYFQKSVAAGSNPSGLWP